MGISDITKEQMEEYLNSGRKVHIMPERDDRFARHTSRFHFLSGPSPLAISKQIENAFRKKGASQKRKTGDPFCNKNGGMQGKHIRGET